MSSSLRTPLGRARGFGAAKSGTGHFIAQRVTAIALALLAPYLFIMAAVELRAGFASPYHFIAQPIIAAPLFVFLLAGLYHMMIGMQVVIEDYIQKPGSKAALLILNGFLVVALAVAGGYAILSISLGV
jgi:succinate dehydrogenase / fumarate reductase membrane anchor subunit